VIRIGTKALKNGLMWAIATASFVAIFFFKVPFPLVVVGAGLFGLFGGLRWPALFATKGGHGGGATSGVILHDDEPPPEHARPTLWRFLRCVAIGLALWFGPLLLVALWRGREDVLTQQAIFFSKCAMVTFGGAYAVLAYISQAAVEQFHWVTAPQMLDGLGLAESTPGPLILVTQFVGFLGAHGTPSDLSPVTMGVLGTLVTLWATFAPCFLWIFAGAPWIERLRGERLLGAALTAITAAVVGVICNLSVWLGLKTLFSTTEERNFHGVHVLVPDLRTIDPFALVIAVAAFVAMKRFKVGIIPVVLVGAAAGFVWKSWLRM
jgi:chromate transporter